jgi:hypothetical protein
MFNPLLKSMNLLFYIEKQQVISLAYWLTQSIKLDITYDLLALKSSSKLQIVMFWCLYSSLSDGKGKGNVS